MLFSKRWLMVIASLVLVTILLSLFLVIPLALANGGTWNPTGSPLVSGGQINTLAVDQSNSNIIYAGVAPIEIDEGSSTIYKSSNGGANWTPVFTAENQLYALVASNTMIYAGGTTHWSTAPSLFVSSDSGANWTPVFTFTRPGNWIDIAIDPTNPNIAVAGGRLKNDATGRYEGLVYKTTDGGASWTEALKISTAGDDIFVTAVLIHPFTPNLWLAAAFDWSGTEETTIYRSTDAGATWSAGWVLNDGGVVSLVGHTGQATVFAGIGPSKFTSASSEAVHRSDDGGQSWGPIFNEGGRLGFVPSSPNQVYLVNEGGGVFSSTAASNFGFWTQANSIDDSAAAFAVPGAPPATLYIGGQQNGIFKSTDQGMNWSMQNNGLTAYPFIVNMAIDPQNINKLFVAALGKGGLRSIDGGSSWQQIPAKFPATQPLPNTIDDFAVDPANSNIIYGGGEGEKQGSGISVGAIIKSDDGGASFTPIYVDPLILVNGRQSIQAIAVAPSSTNIVYAAGENEPNGQDEYGVILRTTDSGANWSTVLTLPFRSGFFALAIHPTNSNIILAGGRNSQSNPKTGIIYRSIDGGNTWQQVMTSSVSNRSTYIASIVFYQADPNIILAADELSRVFRSTDGGDIWTTIKEQDPDYSGRYLAVDPNVPDEIYLGGGLGYVGKSTDSGLTWTDIDDAFRQGTPDELGVSALAVASDEAGQIFWAGFIQLYKKRQLFEPELTVVKTANINQAQVGDTITYTYRITNNSRISVTLTANDDQLGAITLVSSTLQTDQSTTGVASTTILAGHLPGPLTNMVTVTGTPASGPPIVFTATASVNLIEVIAVNTSQPISTTDNILTIPANVLPPEVVTLTFTILEDPSPDTALPADSAGFGFDLKLLNSAGQVITDFNNSPLTITLTYGSLPGGIEEDQVIVFYYDEVDDEWVQVPEEDIILRGSGFIIIRLKHLTEFALTGPSGAGVYLPVILKNQ